MKPSVFIAVPVYRDVQPNTSATLDALIARLKANGIRGSVVIAQSSAPIDRIRSELGAQFLATDCTHMLMIDADVSFHAFALAQMLALGTPVVMAAYPRRPQGDEVRDGRFTVKFLKSHCDASTFPIMRVANQDVLEVAGGGLGCTLVERVVIERLRDAHPELGYVSGDGGEAFSVCGMFHPKIADVDGVRRYLTEDISFFDRVRDAGFHILSPLDVVIDHDGHKGSLREFLETELVKREPMIEAAE
jgi:hypothetical protein